MFCPVQGGTCAVFRGLRHIQIRAIFSQLPPRIRLTERLASIHPTSYRVGVSFFVPKLSGPTADRYRTLVEQARALIADEPDRIANAANLSALIKATVPDLNWVGFYFFDGTELVVGPFQGLPACIRIPLTKGVCGAAARTRTTQRIDDVHAVADHIACDAATNSELVVPLISPAGELIGVLDIDSATTARFTDDDQRGIEALATVYVEALDVTNAPTR